MTRKHFTKRPDVLGSLFYLGGIRLVVSLRIVSRMVVSRFFGSCLGLFLFSVFFFVLSGRVCAKVPKLNTESSINMINFFIDKDLIGKNLCLLREQRSDLECLQYIYNQCLGIGMNLC